MRFLEPAALVAGSASFLAGCFAGWLLRRFFPASGSAALSSAPSAAILEPAGRGLQTMPTPLGPSADNSKLEQLMLGVVDTIDEIELMKSTVPVEADQALALVQGRLEDSIALADGELIRETQWQPALQRAVKVEPSDQGQTDVRLLRARVTGLKHRGRIIRKQEVVISEP